MAGVKPTSRLIPSATALASAARERGFDGRSACLVRRGDQLRRHVRHQRFERELVLEIGGIGGRRHLRFSVPED